MSKERLEYLRGQIQAERISYLELAELQSLAEEIDKDDVELLQWAGVPEFADELDMTGTFRVSFLTEVVPEDRDTITGLVNYVAELAAEWLPDQFVFTVEYEAKDGTWTLGKKVGPC